MASVQLELKLEIALEEAYEVPEQTDIIGLWTAFEPELAQLPQRDYLRVASNVIAELAALCEKKANLLWEDWEDAHNTAGPVMDDDAFSGLVRQTQELDFSDLVQRSYREREPIEYEEDAISAVDKEAVLELLNVISQEKEIDGQSLKAQALSVSHAENISDWIEALSRSPIEAPLRLTEVQARLKMPLMEVWLAALLGGFELEQRGGFYETNEVWISARAQEVKA